MVLNDPRPEFLLGFKRQYVRRSHDFQKNRSMFPQPCPSARPDALAKMNQGFHRAIREFAARGKVYIGTFGIARNEVRARLSYTKLEELLNFHALQRVMQVLTNTSPNDARFRKGLTATNRVDAVKQTFTKNIVKNRWFEKQMQHRNEFQRKYADELKLIHEYFTVGVEAVQQESYKTYNNPAREPLCCHEWYAVTLTPKEGKKIPADTMILGKNLYNEFQSHWNDVKRVVQREGGSMPDAPPPGDPEGDGDSDDGDGKEAGKEGDGRDSGSKQSLQKVKRHIVVPVERQRQQAPVVTYQ